LSLLGIQPSWTTILVLAGIAGLGIYVLNRMKNEEMAGF
jgi:hypothetical protein